MPRPEYVFDTKHDRYPLAVHVFLLDRHGRVLLMRRAGSGYADGQLGLPAGHVDLGETPIECAVREVAEEVGLAVRSGRLLAVHWSAPRPPRPRAFLSFVFDCGTVAADTPIRLQEEELDGYVFAEPARALRLMDPALAPRLEAALRARDRGQTVYVAS